MLLKVFYEIFFQVFYRYSSAGRVIGKLVFSDFPDVEITRMRVRYHETAYGGVWFHHAVFREMYPDFLHSDEAVQQKVYGKIRQ